jgi:hypothetical protein
MIKLTKILKDNNKHLITEAGDYDFNDPNVRKLIKTRTPGEQAKYFESWLTVFGLLPPPFGTAADILGAILAGIRRDWVDVGLSLIALVPYVGDAIKIAARNAPDLFKQLGILIRAKKPISPEWWEAAIDRDIISPSSFKSIEQGITTLVNSINNIKGKVYSIPGVENALKTIDELTAWLNDSRKNLAEVAQNYANKTKLATTGGSASTITDRIKKFTGKLYPVLKYLPLPQRLGFFFSTTQVERLGSMLARNYVDVLKQKPEKLVTIFKLSNEATKKVLNTILSKNGIDLIGSGLLRNRLTDQQMVDLIYNKFFDLTDASKTQLLTDFVNAMIESNHIFWTEYAKMGLKNLNNMFKSNGALSGEFKTFSGNWWKDIKNKFYNDQTLLGHAKGIKDEMEELFADSGDDTGRPGLLVSAVMGDDPELEGGFIQMYLDVIKKQIKSTTSLVTGVSADDFEKTKQDIKSGKFKPKKMNPDQ